MAEIYRAPVILQVLPAMQAGGIERGTVEIVRAVVAHGGTALVASAGGRMVSLVEKAGGEHVTLPLATKNPLGILRNIGRLTRLIRSRQVDLVHARSRAPAWSAMLASRRTDTPFVTTWHGVYGEELPLKKRYNSVMAHGDRVIAISDFVAARIAADYGVGADRLRVVPRGADTELFDPDEVGPERKRELAREWNLPEGAAVVMLPGRITAWKGHALLIDALARLPADAPEWVCVLVGPEAKLAANGRGQGAKLLAQANRLGIGSRIRMPGHTDDMPAALGLAGVVVVPSLKPEPFGRVVVEAQAMGRPVIVAAHGAAMETVQHGVSGYVFEPGDVEALTQLLAHVLALGPIERQHLAYWARSSVVGGYSMSAMQEATMEIYGELLRDRPGLRGLRATILPGALAS